MTAESAMSGDLFAVIGEVPMTDYCGQSYWNWEDKIATPALEALGYKVIRWYSEDSDSFGPLVRAVKVEKDGAKQVLQYG